MVERIREGDIPGVQLRLRRELNAGCEESWRRLVLKGDKLVGALLVGDINRAGIFTGLIREKVSVGNIQDLLLTDEFGLLSLPSEYRKHVVSGEGIEV